MVAVDAAWRGLWRASLQLLSQAGTSEPLFRHEDWPAFTQARKATVPEQLLLSSF